MKKVLSSLTLVSFLVSIYYGLSIYDRYIPPFKTGTCILFDYFDLFEKTGEGEEKIASKIVIAKIKANNLSEGESDLIIAYKSVYELYFFFEEKIPFYNLRLAKPVEVDCEFF
jgi:hypothetical protein